MMASNPSSNANDTVIVASLPTSTSIPGSHPTANTPAPAINGSNHASLGLQSSKTHSANLQNAIPASQTSFGGAMPSVSAFSGETQEILKRVNANATLSAYAGQDAYEAAKEQILKTMTTHRDMPTPPPALTRGRGRGRGRPSKLDTTVRLPADGTDSATPGSAKRGGRAGRPRGRGRGRGRGSGRGGKRKRDDDEDGSGDESDVSNSYTPLPTQTKSGRSVNKPMQYNPAPEASPTSGPKRRRGGGRKGPEYTLCTKCQRGHSPESNQIVYCDGCNTPYHQWCHDPTIPREVVEVAEKEWFCGHCQGTIQIASNVKPEDCVSGEDLTAEEKESYLSNLSSNTLVSLLLYSLQKHPDLPIFAPDSRSLLQPNRSFSKTTTLPTPPTQQPVTSSESHQPVASRPSSLTNMTLDEAHEQSPSLPPNFHPTISNITVNAAAAAQVLATADPPATYPRPLHGPYKLPQTLSQVQSQGQNGHVRANGHEVDGALESIATSTARPLQPPSQPHTSPRPRSIPPTTSNPAPGRAAADADDAKDNDGNDDAGSHHPTDDDDIPWLIDDNFEVFSHLYNDGTGTLVPTERHEAWLRERGGGGGARAGDGSAASGRSSGGDGGGDDEVTLAPPAIQEAQAQTPVQAGAQAGGQPQIEVLGADGA